ncbi:hypothetical protein BDV95DRAFT_498359 [Massariosphaeria phaeospora]|uniref:Uncharacterized protein n=1 Tax=Massariosphaeria phaeospora TaxID=100035 RepID=A0A7C8MKR7_9PLEO|nr:hypothetical protein BDV95DRAFT_498359 [Massariosphaeria phaeospora]
MKLSWSFIASSLYCSAAASQLGHVYIHDSVPNAAPQSPPSVTPETARLILAERLGLSYFHSIESSNDEAIQQINAYGGRQPRLRLLGGGDAGRTKAQVLIWVDDVEDVNDIIQAPSSYSTAFTISSPPLAPDNDRLIQDFILQAESMPKHPDPKGRTYSVGIEVEAALSPLRLSRTFNDYLTIIRAGTADKSVFPDIKERIARILEQASAEKEQGFAITVVLMPPSASHSKRSAHPYGTYSLSNGIATRREKTEAPLSLASSQPATAPQSSNPNISDLGDLTMTTAAEDDNLVLGILPACFETQEVCEKQTRNCSSHGECKVLHKGSAGKGERKDCYGCACQATIHHVGEDKGMEGKKKTTHWGGPACQKKDVSVPFFLFASSGIFLAFLISAGIGMLYTMGSEELPSVIGAGVSGPVRK